VYVRARTNAQLRCCVPCSLESLGYQISATPEKERRKKERRKGKKGKEKKIRRRFDKAATRILPRSGDGGSGNSLRKNSKAIETRTRKDD